jgi:hypothetical protein
MNRGGSHSPAALIIIRLWRADDGPGELRARICVKLNVLDEAIGYASASNLDDLAAKVRASAEAFLAHDPEGT